MVTLDLWTMQPEGTPPEALAMLDAGERRRAARFRHEADRAAYVAAQALQRRVLGRALGQDPAQLSFGRTSFGRPRLEGGGPAFSASRRRGLVAVALGHCAALGVDVEEIRPHEEPWELLDHFLDQAGAGAAGDLADPEAFATLWTITEAAAKARGTGLRRFQPRLMVTRTGQDRFEVRDGENLWSALVLTPDPGHRLALVLPAGMAFRLNHQRAEAAAWA